MSAWTSESVRLSHRTLFIHRKGNGGAHLVPPVMVLRRGEAFWVVNVTECPARVAFPARISDPPEAEVTAGDEVGFTVPLAAVPGYYEYDVALFGRRGEKDVVEHAYGNSRPGVIIDR